MDTNENRRETDYVLYAGRDLGYQDSAMHLHAMNIAEILIDMGYSIIYVSQKGWKPGMHSEEIQKRFHCFYSESRAIPNTRLRRIYRRFNEITGLNQWKTIERVCNQYNPKLIINYGCVCASKLIRYSKKKRVPVIFDLTDWFESSELTDFYSKYIWGSYVDKCMNKTIFNASGVIAISRYLYEHFATQINTINIPALCTLKEEPIYDVRRGGVCRIVYAGSAGKKDIIWPAVRAIIGVNEEIGETRIVLDLVGIDMEIAKMNLNSIDLEKDYITYHGKLAHVDAIQIVRKADFSILLRENRRYAKAGFSTKFVESMWLGVPVICTGIGGTDSCIENMINGVVIADNSEKTIKYTLLKLISMSDEEIMIMKQNAYNYAREKFNYRTYIPLMRTFLEDIGKGRNSTDGVENEEYHGKE